MPDVGDGRVKAYRKQARDGTLPPVLLWWVSGLDCHLVLDGHARLAAAIANRRHPRCCTCTAPRRATRSPRAPARAVRRYLKPNWPATPSCAPSTGAAVPDGTATAGPTLARRLRELRTASRPSWAWPLPGGAQQWHRVAGGRDLRPVMARRRPTPGPTAPPGRVTPPGLTAPPGGSRPPV
ncbi:hypothetical protein LT493_18650 [Streptomyces tricolor]|nr:hypothetical protein [Streptomyces tricolor]